MADDLLKQTATTIDTQLLAGDGSAPNVRGLRNIASVTAGPSLGTNGATPTLDNFATCVESLETRDADLSRRWFIDPRTWVSSASSRTARTGTSWDRTDDRRTEVLSGVPVFTTANISITETTGTSSDTSYAILVDMDQVLVAQRKQVELTMSTDYAFNADQTALRVVARYDLAAPNPKAIVLCQAYAADPRLHQEVWEPSARSGDTRQASAGRRR